MKPQIVEAFYTKIDEAGLFWAMKHLSQTQLLNLLKIQAKLLLDQSTMKTFLNWKISFMKLISTLMPLFLKSKTALHCVNLATATRKQFTTKQLIPLMVLLRLTFKSKQFKKGDLLAGDFNSLIYGVPYNINFKISEEGQISTMKNSDGTPINLFEQEMVAIRVTMDIAVMVTKANAFAKLTATAENI